MTRLILAILVFGGLTLFSFWQLIRGFRTGRVTAFTGGKQNSRAFECRRSEQPIVFWHTMVWYVIAAYAGYWVLSEQTVGPYVWGATAPTISVVQPYERYDMQLYWDPPERFVDPISYNVHRLNTKTGEYELLGNAVGGPGVGQYIDDDVEEGTEYTYRVEAVYDDFTTRVIGDQSCMSTPLSGRTFTW